MSRCDREYDLVAYLKGEIAEGERAPVRAHVESCAACGREVGRVDALLRALGRLPVVEPSPDFRWRVREAFAAAHPEFVARRCPGERLSLLESIRAAFGHVPAWALSVAIHVVLLAIAAVLFLSPRSPQEEYESTAIRVPPPGARGAGLEPGGGPLPSAHVPPERDAEGPDRGTIRPRTDPGHRTLREPVSERDRETWRRSKLENPIARLGSGRVSGRDADSRTSAGVSRALGWLAAAQSEDGSWRSARFGGKETYDVGLTGLSLLAFLAEGHTHRSGAYAASVRRGLDFLLAQQKRAGLVGSEGGNYMYNHALGGLAILEAWILTGDEALADPARWAVSFSLQAQNEKGGWDYRFGGGETDTSVGAWQILLLRLARENGTDEVVPSLMMARDRILELTDSEGQVGYRARSQYPNGPYALTALGALAYVMAGPVPETSVVDRYARVLQAGLDAHPLSPDPSRRNENDLYFAHFGSLALHQVGGPAWNAWHGTVRDRLLSMQQSDGSWPANADRWSAHGGQIYTTAMSALTLQTPYRYPRFSR